MKQITIYYNNFQIETEISNTDHTKLIDKWRDIGNRGGVISITSKHESVYDIDLTLVQLIKTN